MYENIQKVNNEKKIYIAQVFLFFFQQVIVSIFFPFKIRKRKVKNAEKSLPLGLQSADWTIRSLGGNSLILAGQLYAAY